MQALEGTNNEPLIAAEEAELARLLPPLRGLATITAKWGTTERE
jgi:hypothetical protein